MTQREESISSGRLLEEWHNYLLQKLSSLYDSFSAADGETWFKRGVGAFHLCAFETLIYGFIIEYAKGITERDLGGAIDGDQWPLLNYDSPEDMLQAMLIEIEA